MMKLRIDRQTIESWKRDLSKAGQREIGGVLFGEQVGEGDFRILKASRQRFGGGEALHFNRRGFQARGKIKALHKKYGGDPSRFNYLGEWHSHPNAPAIPSMQDEMTMYQLLADQAGVVNFLVLAIVRLARSDALEIGAITYLTSGHKIECEIERDEGPNADED